MKNIIIVFALLLIGWNLSAQKWKGSTTINGNLYRNGNVGIGTKIPSNNQGWNKVLDVAGDNHSKILSTSKKGLFRTGIYSHNTWYGGGGFIGTESNHNLHLITGYAPRLSILTNGNVGIGTKIPSNSQNWNRVLDVAGDNHSKILSTSKKGLFKTGIYSHNTWYGGGGFIGTESNHNLHLITGYAPRLSILTNGNVGIGTKTPSNNQGWNKVLDVAGDNHSKVLSTSKKGLFRTGIYSHTTWHGGGGFIGTESNHNLHLITGYAPRLSILTNGNVGIGTKNPGVYKLAVNGKVRAKEVVVETGWSDFVFEKDYKLPTLKEVEQHIKKHGHLKDIPSAKEISEKGVKLGQMESKLLQKIEELTLYIIKQNKSYELLESKLKRLESKLNQN